MERAHREFIREGGHREDAQQAETHLLENADVGGGRRQDRSPCGRRTRFGVQSDGNGWCTSVRGRRQRRFPGHLGDSFGSIEAAHAKLQVNISSAAKPGVLTENAFTESGRLPAPSVHPTSGRLSFLAARFALFRLLLRVL